VDRQRRGIARRRTGCGIDARRKSAVFALARYAILDTLFAAFLFGGASCVTVAALKDRPRLQWPGYVLVGLAILTKGPLALALCGLAFRDSLRGVERVTRRRLWRLHWAAGLAVAVAIAAPWFLYMDRRFGEAFINGYVLDENFRLFATSRFANQPGPWFYFQILATGLLPWTGLLLGRLIDDAVAVATGARVDAFEILLWSWVAAVVGFFTASTFKLDHYVFPAARPVSVIRTRLGGSARGATVAAPSRDASRARARWARCSWRWASVSVTS
jgi:4-amino-4-deoxy-L-arabinose transferase-like glycosyltransferase